MEIPSAFYTWLCDQVAYEDAVGELAAYAVLDESWPKAEATKESLRSYLRSKGLRKFVPSLAIAFDEFDQAMETHFKSCDETVLQNLDLNRSRVAEPAFHAWCDLGCPDPAKIASLAESGDPLARIVFAVRLLLGIGAPANPLLAIRNLTSVFAAGTTAAAVVLERYYGLLLDIKNANEWLVHGARSGDKGCICTLHARIAAVKSLRLTGSSPEIDAAELQALIDTHVGDTGEPEWTLAGALAGMKMTDDALALYQTAADKGWCAAFGDGASLLQKMERTREARDWLERGAEKGDYLSKGKLAAEILERELDGGPRLPVHEREVHIRNLEIAAEHAVRFAFFPLAALYAKGDGVPKDASKALTLLTITFVTAADEIEEDDIYEFSAKLFPDFDGDFAISSAVAWVIAAAQKTRARDISALAADAWLDAGMVMPQHGEA